MKVQIEKENLIKGVQTVQNIVPLRSTLPILANILIEAGENKLKLTATDLEIGMQCTIPAEILQPGAITIPAKKFSEIIRELPNTTATLTALKNNTMSITSQEAFFKLLGLPKDDFPAMPQLQEEEALEVDQSILKHMLNMTSFAISHDEVRYILNGVLLLADNTRLRLAATDGRRLAVIDRDTKAPGNIHRQIIIPTKAVCELNRILQEEGTVKIIFGENQAMFKIENVVIITRLIEGEYPNYEQVIPEEAQNKIRVNTQRFLWGARRAGLLTHQDSQAIKIDVLKDKMVISKNTPQLGEMKDQIDIKYDGKEMTIGFNPHYLIDPLKNIEQEEINLELTGPDKAGVIRTEDKYTYLILPMQVA